MENLQNLFSLKPAINLWSIKREILIWLGLGIVLYGISYLLDTTVFDFIDVYFRRPWIDHVSVLLTEQLVYGIFILFLLGAVFRAWYNEDNRSKLLPGAFALCTTSIVTVVIKQFFAIPRPFLQFENLDPLVSASFASFPSGHTAASFSLLIPLYRANKVLGCLWGFFAVLIGISRIYQNVHFPSDIAGGIFLGGVIGAIFSNPNTELLLRKWWKELEFRRQSFHFLSGFLCVFALWAGILNWWVLLILLFVGLVISAISVKRTIPYISDILKMFDRKRDQKFPGRGAFYYVLGIFLAIFLFPTKIAYASVLILAVGDSLNHLFWARSPRRINLPWNRRKHVIGVLIGILAGTFAAQFFVPLIPAFVASSVALISETFPLKIRGFYIDDNVFIPLIAGGILFILA